MQLSEFVAEDLQELALQPMQVDMQALLAEPGYGPALVRPGESFTARVQGRVIGCGGLLAQWPGVARAWVLLAGELGPAMIGVHRVVADMLARCSYHRVEMTVTEGFAEGVRWAEMLGFVPEGLMRAYTANRRNAWLMAKVRDR